MISRARKTVRLWKDAARLHGAYLLAQNVHARREVQREPSVVISEELLVCDTSLLLYLRPKRQELLDAGLE